MSTAIDRPARVGVITDQTGALSFMGIANANVAKMVIDDINDRGGLLGRPVELFIEDSATDDSVAEAAAARLVERAAVDVVVGGIYSSTRQAIKRPAVDRGRKLYIYPEQYEGQECHPLIFCTGPVPAQQVDPFFPWLMQHTGAKKFYLPSADYIWPHTMNKKVRDVVAAGGGSIVGEEYFPLDHTDYQRTVEDIMSTGAEVVFNTIVPRASRRSSSSSTTPASRREAGTSCAPTSTRTSSTWCRASTSRACTGAWTTTETSRIRSAPSSSTATTRAFPVVRCSRQGVRARGCTGA
jgi:ABC-type branched-subunit amino acid transport system substrate-binding protein